MTFTKGLFYVLAVVSVFALPVFAQAGTSRSDAEIKQLLAASEQGDARAQYDLGACYANGDGVEQSFEEAVKWYRKSAEQSNVDAQNALGACYLNGRGVPQSEEEAAKWLRKALGKNVQVESSGCAFIGINLDPPMEDPRVVEAIRSGVTLDDIDEDDLAQANEVIWQRVTLLSQDELRGLCGFYFENHLEPKIKENEGLKPAENRLLRLCAAVELYHAGVLRTALANLYGFNIGEYTSAFDGCLATEDHEKVETIKNMFCLSLYYRESTSYEKYVLGMKRHIFPDSFNIESESRNIIYKILDVAMSDRSDNLRTYERDVPGATLWNRGYILRDEALTKTWVELRNFYETDILGHLEQYQLALDKNASMSKSFDENKRNKDFANTFSNERKMISKSLHRMVYDAPYTLLISNFNHEIVKSVPHTNAQCWYNSVFNWFFARGADDVLQVEDAVQLYMQRLGDVDNIMDNLSTRVAVKQTGRSIELLKMAWGRTKYEAEKKLSQLLKLMEKVEFRESEKSFR